MYKKDAKVGAKVSLSSESEFCRPGYDTWQLPLNVVAEIIKVVAGSGYSITVGWTDPKSNEGRTNAYSHQDLDLVQSEQPTAYEIF